MRRVVVDTNVFISAIFWKGKPRQVIDVFVSHQATLVLSQDILTELEQKLHGEKFSSELSETGLSVGAIVAGFRKLSEIVEPVPVPDEVVRDRKDRIILECGVGGEADYIVSGDKDLTELGEYAGISIVTPAQFLQLKGSF